MSFVLSMDRGLSEDTISCPVLFHELTKDPLFVILKGFLDHTDF